jgi:hypothetical protein
MSTANKIAQFVQLYKTFTDLHPERAFEPLPSHGDFDGPNPEETRDTLKFLRSVLDPVIADETLHQLPWHTYNGIFGVVQNAYNAFTAYQASRDQSSYQNFAAHLDSFAYHIRMFGFVQLYMGEGKLEQTKATVDKELERLLVNNREVEALKGEVRTLIAPAVAGSLSEAFTSRRNALLRGRVIWALIAGVGGVASIWATFSFVSAVSDALLKTASASTQGTQVWPIALIRSAILIPLYAAFGFAFAQYKKERDFEEEYAHKAAVATSLPNYGDLAREPAVRDQIVTGATNVIFTSPTSRARERAKSDLSLGGLRELVDSIAKLGGKKD